MDFHARCVDIGRIAEKGEPHVFDVKIVEGLQGGGSDLWAEMICQSHNTLYNDRLNSWP
jgi:hypothetical protein